MAINWGSEENHLRAGVETEVIGLTSTSVTVRFYFWVGAVPSGWTWNDGQTAHISGSVSGTINYQKGGGDQRIGSRTVTRSRSFSGGPTLEARIRISGAYNGATPSKTETYTVPARSVSPPNPPWGPGIEVNPGVGIAGINWGLSTNNNGDNVGTWRTQVGSSRSYGTTYLDEQGSDRSAFVSGLNRATEYFVRVKGRNSAGWGDWSADKPFTTQPDHPGVVPRNGSDVSSTTATLSWNPPSDDGGRSVDGYRLRWKKVSSSSWTEVVETSTGRVVTGLDPGTAYEYLVLAFNSVGDGPFQSEAQGFTTTISTPSAPPRPTMGTIVPTAATLSWSAPASNGSPITGYHVQYSTSSSFTGSTTDTIGNTTSALIDELSADTTYYVRVRAFSAEGNGLWSPSRSFSTDPDPTFYPIVNYWGGSGWIRLNPSAVWDGEAMNEVSDIKFWDGSAWADVATAPY